MLHGISVLIIYWTVEKQNPPVNRFHSIKLVHSLNFYIEIKA